MSLVSYSFAEQFTAYPGGRFKKNGPFSGEEFKEKILLPIFENDDIIEINCDGVMGFTASFIDSSFAEVANKYKLKKYNETIKIISNDDPSLNEEIMYYVNKALNGN